jgi:hypothetical protein
MAEANGLKVDKQLSQLSGRPLPLPYAIIHKASGLPVVDGFQKFHQAVLAMTRIAPMADWTKSEPWHDTEELIALNRRVRQEAERARA